MRVHTKITEVWQRNEQPSRSGMHHLVLLSTNCLYLNLPIWTGNLAHLQALAHSHMPHCLYTLALPILQLTFPSFSSSTSILGDSSLSLHQSQHTLYTLASSVKVSMPQSPPSPSLFLHHPPSLIFQTLKFLRTIVGDSINPDKRKENLKSGRHIWQRSCVQAFCLQWSLQQGGEFLHPHRQSTVYPTHQVRRLGHKSSLPCSLTHSFFLSSSPFLLFPLNMYIHAHACALTREVDNCLGSIKRGIGFHKKMKRL